MTPTEQAREFAGRNLAAYTRYMWPRFERAQHHNELIKCLHQLTEPKPGTEPLDRFIVTMPPRHGKSTIVSQYFPAWYMGRHPDRYIIACTYSQELATDFGAKVRNLVADPMHREVFPHCVMSDDTASKQRFATTQGGVYHAVGVGGSITGRGAHVLLIDDPLKDKAQAFSEAERRVMHEWFQFVAYTRLMPGGKIIIVSTRWHTDDLVGRQLALEVDGETRENWKVLNMPAIAEEGDRFRKVGEPLWPERYPLDVLERTRNAVGPEAWLALYQQRPAEAQGNVFLREWLQTYERAQPSTLNRYIIVDPANSKKRYADYSVFVVVGLGADGNYYLLDLVRDRLNLVERTSMLFKLHRKWKPLDVGYEQYGMQSDIQHIRAEMERNNYRFSVRELGGTTRVKKEERIRALLPMFRDGRFWLPESDIKRTCADGRDHQLCYEFVEHEYATYPACRHDDVLDTLSHLVMGQMNLTWPLANEFDDGWGNVTADSWYGQHRSWMTA